MLTTLGKNKFLLYFCSPVYLQEFKQAVTGNSSSLNDPVRKQFFPGVKRVASSQSTYFQSMTDEDKFTYELDFHAAPMQAILLKPELYFTL